jgi:single-stranded DNA-binding protein
MDIFINRIELQGVVGNATIQTIQANNVARFSLLVEEAYNGEDGPIIQSNWFNCVAWQSDTIKELKKIKKGARVHLKGRVKMQGYVDNTGTNRHVWEVVCQELEVLTK